MSSPSAESPVEDPVEALLALAESARGGLRRFGFVTAYGLLAGLFAASIVIPVGVIGLLVGGGEPAYLIALTAGVVSLVAVVLAYRIDRLLSSFDRRLRSIEGFVRFNPRPRIPEGQGAVDRAVAWLEGEDESFRKALSQSRDRLARNVRALGPDSPPLTAHFLRKSMYLPAQYHLIVHTLDKRAEIEDLRQVKEAAQRMAVSTGVPPDRVLVVQTVPAEIPEEVERWLDSNWVLAPRKRRRVCPLQLLVERDDGRYEVAPVYAG